MAIATDDIAKITSREVDKQLGGSDHKPIVLTMERKKTPPEIYQSPSWNFKKTNCDFFKKSADENCKNINLEQHHLNKLTQLITESILDAAKKYIPRDRRKQYTPGGTTNYRSCMMRSAETPIAYYRATNRP